MEQLLNKNGKMTSLVIAELTGKPHYDVMKAIRKMEESWMKIGQGKFSVGSYYDKNKQARPMYSLSKSECLYVATKFNDEARAKLVIRWEELEKEHAEKTDITKLPRIEILRMAVEAEERSLLLEQEIKVQAPKVKYFDNVLESKSTYATTLIAKELGMSGIALNKLLHDCKIQHKIDSTWVLYSKYQNKGYTKTKTYTFVDSNGESRTSMQTTWTEKGRHFIHEIVHNHQLEKMVS